MPGLYPGRTTLGDNMSTLSHLPKEEKHLAFELPDLAFDIDALEPWMSRRTLELHHGRHHAGYVKKLNGLIEGTKWESTSLDDIVRGTYGDEGAKAIFNNAAQDWNHGFFWRSMSPDGGGEPGGDLAARLAEDFGSLDGFRAAFKEAAAGLFGSGWTWLVADGDKLEIAATQNAVTPIVDGKRPLLTLDVWEHAYYVDYQNDRGGFIDAFLEHLVNWSFAADNLAGG
jgi:Fe-Mn family superoxide dismutase